MKVDDTENFPRGGKQVVETKPYRKRKLDENLFDLENRSKIKKPRKEKKIERKDRNTEDNWQASLKFQGTLTYNRIQDGMTILSCVRHISNLALQIEFPGLTFGTVTINEISDTFTNTLTQKLKENNDELCLSVLKNMFTVGQLLPAKIISNEETEKGHKINATINPRNINSDRKHTLFKKGTTVWANVVSELDHGYELTVGVNNCRVFLPSKNISPSVKYEIGETLYCVILKVETSQFASTLTVGAKPEYLDNPQLKEGLTLDDIIPGTKVECVIDELTPHGIKGRILENCLAYLDDSQLFSRVKKAKLVEGTPISAYVLYIEPLTKVVYLTLRGLDILPKPEFKIGQITSAKVLMIVSEGLSLQLGKNITGFVTNKRLLKTLPKDAHLNIIDAVRKKYPVGSNHDCRILDFNHMQQMYVCTLEKQVIKEKIFSIDDLNIGQIVTVKVDRIVSNGLVVKIGHIQGFVPNLHLSNIKYSETIKAKFSIGMELNARVLNITNDNNVIFTLKQSLVESDNCLTKVEDATPNSQFTGFVIQTKISGAGIAFYSDVKGWISNKVLNFGNTGRYVDPREYFFLGQVVNVYILQVQNGKLQLSLKPIESVEKVKRKKATKKKVKKEKKTKVIEMDGSDPKTELEVSQNNKSNNEEVEVNEAEEESGEDSAEDSSMSIQNKKERNRESVLSGVASFYNMVDHIEEKTSSEEDDDEEEAKEKQKKKKKLTSAERAEMVKKEEERISRIEKELADSTSVPQSAQEFDRLLLADPNSSKLWLQYIAMHVATTELEKARAVGKRAIETINPTMIEERFNVWVALLNLENLYGTKETFEQLFLEAVKCNDSLDIYLNVIKMFAKLGKLVEMEEKIKKVKTKEKQNSKMWLEIGQVYYSLGKYKEARNMKAAALKSILEKKRQFDLIVKFGIMEFQLGELEQAIANFETILDTYPNKVNVWIIYVDQLVKQKQIESARKVLQRAVSQKFPVRTMKILFQKFINFEEEHGNAENVKDIKHRAKEYVQNLVKIK